MAEFLFANNAATTLAAGISNSATSLTVATGTGSLFPSPGAGQQFNVTLIKASDGSYEIVKVTARSTDTFTIVRAQESTTALAFSTSDKVELRVTAAGLSNLVQDSDIGSTVQAYDADTAKTDATQTFTVPQRGTVTTDNDLSFDLNATNNFSSTPTGAGTLTFTNIAAGQSGFILLVNGSNYAIAAHANTKITATDLAKISVTGTYVISYFSNGTNVYCAVGGAY